MFSIGVCIFCKIFKMIFFKIKSFVIFFLIEFLSKFLKEIFWTSYSIIIGNRRNCTRKYDQKRDPEEHREETRQSRKRKIEALSNIEGENQPQLEVETCM